MQRTVTSLLAVVCTTLLLAGCAAPLADSPSTTNGDSWLPAGATVHADLAYGSDPNQRLDVYEPKDAKDAPILFMVHGGGWKRGDKAASGVVHNKVAHYLPMGFVVVSTNYRLVPAVTPVTEADDVAAALAYVQNHASEWGASSKDVVLIGHSAGANLVSLLAADPSIAADAGASPWLGTIVLDSGGYNVVTIMTSPHLKLFDEAFGTDPELWKASSPTLRLSTAPLPMLLVCDSNRKNSCAQAKAFTAAVVDHFGSTAGSGIQVYPIAMTHGDINSTIGTPGPLTDTVDQFLRTVGLTISVPTSG